jgi:uncharacterized membrane protein
MWGGLKALVYSAPINDLELLQKRIENACREIQVKPEIFGRLLTSVRRRAKSYVEMHGNPIRSHVHRPQSADIGFWT